MFSKIILISLFLLISFIHLESSEFRVNEYCEGVQTHSATAMDDDGNFIIAWNSVEQDGSGLGIFARRFDKSGNPIVDEFQVNTTTGGDQRDPSIGMNGNGRFVITWMSGDSSNYDIYAQLYDENGIALGKEFKVNSYTDSIQSGNSAAMDGSGNFLIAWFGFGQNEGYSYDIYAQKYDRDGNPIGDNFKVNTIDYGIQSEVTVSTNNSGNYLISWSSCEDNSAISTVIYARRYDKNGEPLGDQFRVNQNTQIFQLGSFSTIDREGNFAIIWLRDKSGNSGKDICCRRYDKYGTPLCEEFIVNFYTVFNHYLNIASDDLGNFIVTWENGKNSHGWDLYARKFNREGEPEGTEFKVNSNVFQYNRRPNIAMRTPENFVITWYCFNQEGSEDIYAKLYGDSFPLSSPWPMFLHDAKHTGRSPFKGPDTPELKWMYYVDTQFPNFCQPIIGNDGSIYWGSSDEVFYAFNHDGTLKWTFTNWERIFYSSPSIGLDGTIYTGINEYFYAFNPEGISLWSKDYGKGLSVSSTIDADGTIYSPTTSNFCAFNPDGSLKWSYKPEYAPPNIRFVSSPAIGDDGTIYVGINSDLVALSPDGTLKWSLCIGISMESSPSIGNDGTIYSASDVRDLFAVDPKGTIKWSYPIGEQFSKTPPTISQTGTIYMGSLYNKLYALNPDGTLKWTYSTGVGNGWVKAPIIDSNDILYFTRAGTIFALYPDSTLKWYYIHDHFIEQLSMDCDGTIYASASNGLLAIGSSDGTNPTPTSTPEITNSPIYNICYVDANEGSDLDGDGSREKPWKTITYALTNYDGTEEFPYLINIAPGNYDLINGEIFPLNLESHLILSGSGNTDTILDADGSDESVLSANSVENILLKNLCVTKGTGTFNWGWFKGGGLYSAMSKIDIEDCHFYSNDCYDTGGGIYAFKSVIDILNTEFSYNISHLGAGLQCIDQSRINIDNCYFHDNYSDYDGGGLRCEYSLIGIHDSVFENNYANGKGGAVVAWNYSDPELINCLFVNNANSSKIGQGGALYFDHGTNSVIENCTLADNISYDGGGVKSHVKSVATIKDSIIWNNQGGAISGTVNITFSDVEGGYAGEGNFDQAPLFVSDTDRYYYLSQIASGQNEESPCVDAGSDTAKMCKLDNMTTRTDGIFDSDIVDLGYHYFPKENPIPTVTITQTMTSSVTPTPTKTFTQTDTPSVTPTPTVTATQTITSTLTPTITEIETDTPQPTDTPTPTKSLTLTLSPTSTATNTITSTPTESETYEDTLTPTVTQTPSLTQTPTITETSILTPTPTITPSERVAIFGLGLNAEYAGEWEDTFVDENNPRTNFGKEESLYLSNYDGHRKYTHIRVNIDLLPDDAEILDAKLYFYVTGNENEEPIDIATYALEGLAGSNWSETGDTFDMYNKDVLDGNWTHNEGGSMDKSSETIASNNWQSGIGWKVIEFNNYGLNYLGSKSNEGVCNLFTCILPDSSRSETYAQEIASSENSDGALPPYLKIVYRSGSTFEQSLKITSPDDFYNNTILLSWTPINNASYYQLDFMIKGQVYSFDVYQHWLRIIAKDDDEWERFSSLGTIFYRVMAFDSSGNLIKGPTENSNFTCYTEQNQETKISIENSLNDDSIQDYLYITNPPEFYYNTIILSWTPITGADHYKIEYKSMGETFSVDLNENWMRLVSPDLETWNLFTSFTGLKYRVSAIDMEGIVIDGPTGWSNFNCY